MVSVLFARADSNYKTLDGVDVWDAERDARNWPGGNPVVAHPPCRAWGVLKHMAKPRPGERELALFAIEQVRKWGGALEHPAGSELWAQLQIPELCLFTDSWGGYTVMVDQFDFGHVAHKPTKVYVCGCTPDNLPVMPKRRNEIAAKSITGQVPGTRRCTQREREYTPARFAQWLVAVARRCSGFARGDL
jgi:hypothetical protein